MPTVHSALTVTVGWVTSRVSCPL